ncbi:basement membrane-specific heparan sulfate proteoglycan core protein-like [Mizuhopecten yessoensis]|uniref:basement membrane-specific heparan sulfate proteoglycan core protein-like n=1 Tax=Mizuhopecten yessoensis TaxID=6573 RepID=UPI000B459D5D|nr:basement membrane-specific heparan sulfate proteoglycan core protein-like [Mizuhopecten yessoensis]
MSENEQTINTIKTPTNETLEANYIALIGERVELNYKCSVAATPWITSVSWQLILPGGRSVPLIIDQRKYKGSNPYDPHLVVNELTKDDEGEYVCTVSNLCGKGQSALTKLNVEGGTPTVETLEANYTALIGERVELKCSVAAIPWITSVSWQHILPGGRSVQLNIDQWKYKGSNPYDPHLVINELTKDDEGAYVCTVSNLCGKGQSAPTKLNVEGGTPTVETLEANYTALIGERLELKCSVAATPWVTSVSWQHILPRGRSVQLSIDQRKYKGSNPYDPHLIINELTKDDEGEYVCTVSNLCGKGQSAPTKLNVEGGTPTVETLEANYTALIGERLELKCSVAATPWITSVSWQHILPRGRSVQLSIDQRKYKGSTPYDPHLVINELTKDDEGEYVCTVSNLCGKGQSAPTKLNVEGGTPTVETLEANYTALIGKRVELKCSVAATPWITSVSWQHVLPGGRSVQLSIDQRKYKGSNLYDPHLVINELTKDDEGAYVCTVSNLCGKGQSAPTKLNVEGGQIEEPIPDMVTKERIVSRHGQMVNDLSDIICPEEKDQWAKFTELLKAFVPTRELSKSFHKIIDYLMQQEMITYGHYDKLAEVVYQTHKNDLDIIRKAEADIRVLERGVTSEEPVVIECVYGGEYKSELLNKWVSQIKAVSPQLKRRITWSGCSGSIVLRLTISGAETPHELSALYLAEKVKVYLQKERIVLKDESGEPLKLQTTPKVMIPTKETPTVRFSKGYYQFAEGETAIVRCAMVLNSEVECIEWFRVKDGTYHAIRINNKKYFGGPKSPSLCISDLNEDDRGMYICRISNGASKAESDIAYIEIQSSGLYKANSEELMKERIAHEHAKMVTKLSEYISPKLDTWSKFRELIRWALPTAYLEEDLNSIVESLMKKHHIDYGQYQTLYEAVDKFDRNPSIIIKSAEARIKAIRDGGKHL